MAFNSMRQHSGGRNAVHASADLNVLAKTWQAGYLSAMKSFLALAGDKVACEVNPGLLPAKDA